MYKYIMYALVCIFMMIGVIMAIIPKKVTRKEQRESIESVKSTRRNGICMIVLGLILFVVVVFRYWNNV